MATEQQHYSRQQHCSEQVAGGAPRRVRIGRPWTGTVATVLRNDLPASFVVFLVAVPLSLGIAAACGAPLIAGLIAAVVGGILGGALSGAPLQVSGPAAGLIVIVAGLIGQFGWAATAAITACAGAVQVLLGLSRAGRLALSLSPAVVHGMLAGVGVVIVVGQLHVVLGGTPTGSVIENLWELPTQLVDHHTGSLLVGAVTIAVMLLWPNLPRLSVVPAPMAAVAVGTALAAALRLDVASVDLPADLVNQVVLPRLPQAPLSAVIGGVLTVAVVASVESLLSAVAVDKLHDGPRANLDRELVAQGAANLVSGALGGLPVAGVIVRSSTNVSVGARTRASTILHGLWLLVAVTMLAGLLDMIPLATLAGVLVVIGARLVDVQHMKRLRRHREMLVYCATVLGVIGFGLVEGVLIGLAVAMLRALYRLTHSTVEVIRRDGGDWLVNVRGSLVFLGVGRLVRALRALPTGERVVLELHVDFMDHGVFEAISDWISGYERRDGRVRVDEVFDSWYHRAVSGRPLARKTVRTIMPRWFAPWTHWQNSAEYDGADDGGLPAPRHPDDPLLTGVRAFQRHSAELVRPFLADLAENGQRPDQLFITCSDSRVIPNMITSSGPGDQFCVRNIGNLVPRHAVPSDASVGAAVEFAVDVLGVREIVVCGHSDCGAMRAVVDSSARPGSALHAWLRHAEESVLRLNRAPDRNPELPPNERLCLANVTQQLENLLSYPTVRSGVEAGRLRLTGLYFDISTAKVYLVDPDHATLSEVGADQ